MRRRHHRLRTDDDTRNVDVPGGARDTRPPAAEPLIMAEADETQNLRRIRFHGSDSAMAESCRRAQVFSAWVRSFSAQHLLSAHPARWNQRLNRRRPPGTENLVPIAA